MTVLKSVFVSSLVCKLSRCWKLIYMMYACHVERSEAKSKHLPKDTIPLGCAYSEILRLRPTGFAQNDRYINSIN